MTELETDIDVLRVGLRDIEKVKLLLSKLSDDITFSVQWKLSVTTISQTATVFRMHFTNKYLFNCLAHLMLYNG